MSVALSSSSGSSRDKIIASKKSSPPNSPPIPSPLTPPATGESKDRSPSTVCGSNDVHRRPSVSAAQRATQSASPPFHLTYPIRDSPSNPFLQGGPADIGLSGPWRRHAEQRAASHPERVPGKMVYVFRGQRVVYADPYASDSEASDEEADGTTKYGAYATREHTLDRLQPRLLFPRATHKTGTSKKIASKRIAQAPRHQPQSPNLPPQSSAVKRQRVELSAANQSLLERIDRAGWGSSDGEDWDGETEAKGSGLASVVIDDHGDGYDMRADFTDSDDEPEEIDDNPFLDAAPAVVTSTRPISGLPSRTTSFQQMAAQAQQLCTHAHSLSTRIHIPDHFNDQQS